MILFALHIVLCLNAYAAPTPDKTPSDERLLSIERRLDRLEKIVGVEGKSKTPTKATVKKNDRQEPLAVELVEKGFHQMDVMNGDGENRITFTLSIKNKLDRGIRAFTGILIFNDLFDREILSSPMTVDDAIGANGEVSWQGGLPYNQFMTSNSTLLAKDKADIHIAFKVSQIIFDDGSKQSF